MACEYRTYVGTIILCTGTVYEATLNWLDCKNFKFEEATRSAHGRIVRASSPYIGSSDTCLSHLEDSAELRPYIFLHLQFRGPLTIY